MRNHAKGYQASAMNILEINPTAENIMEANSRCDINRKRFGTINTKLPEKPRNHGFMGEVACKHYLKDMEYATQNEYDLINKSTGATYDCKTHTLMQTPADDDACNIPCHSKVYSDFLIFSYAFKDLSKVWIVGFISTRDFYEKAVERPVGYKAKYYTYDRFPRFEIKMTDLADITKLMQ
jgi:hypothetical protein